MLPPWGRLYHWQSPDIHQVRIPWSDFFDLPSLNRNIPVIEYEQFIAGEVGGGPLTGARRSLVWCECPARPETLASGAVSPQAFVEGPCFLLLFSPRPVILVFS